MDKGVCKPCPVGQYGASGYFAYSPQSFAPFDGNLNNNYLVAGPNNICNGASVYSAYYWRPTRGAWYGANFCTAQGYWGTGYWGANLYTSASVASIRDCDACPEGMTTNGTGATSCSYCPEGTTLNATSYLCQNPTTTTTTSTPTTTTTTTPAPTTSTTTTPAPTTSTTTTPPPTTSTFKTTTTTSPTTTTTSTPSYFVRYQVTSARDPSLFTAGILAQYQAAIASMAGVAPGRVTITIQAQARRLLTGTVLVINIAADTSADALAIATRVTQPNLNAALSSAGLASLTYDTNSLYVTAPSITTTGAAAPGTTGQTIIFTPPPSSSSGSIVAPLAIAGACCALLLLTISQVR